MSSVETGQMSAVETGQMTAAGTAVLSQQKTSVLSQRQILSVSEICRGHDTSKWPDLDNRKVTFQTDGTPKSRIAVRFQWAQYRGELLKNQKKIKWQGVTVSAAGHDPKNRKWPQNGPQELRIEPRASNGSEKTIATDPGARKGRQSGDSAKSGWSGPGTLLNRPGCRGS